MSEHSKGTELRYDAEKGEIRRGRELMADVYLPCGPYGPALAERDALGRKMAAAPELVEALEAIGMLPDGFCVCPSGRDPTRPEPEHGGECRDARAALKKAGVKP